VNEEIDLTDALEKLIKGRGREAADLASNYPDSWVAKCIFFLANSFFLYDPITAATPFGGMDRIAELMKCECVERYFLV